MTEILLGGGSRNPGFPTTPYRGVVLPPPNPALVKPTPALTQEQIALLLRLA